MYSYLCNARTHTENNIYCTLTTHKQRGLNGPMDDVEQLSVWADPTPETNTKSRKSNSRPMHVSIFTHSETKRSEASVGSLNHPSLALDPVKGSQKFHLMGQIDISQHPLRLRGSKQGQRRSQEEKTLVCGYFAEGHTGNICVDNYLRSCILLVIEVEPTSHSIRYGGNNGKTWRMKSRNTRMTSIPNLSSRLSPHHNVIKHDGGS